MILGLYFFILFIGVRFEIRRNILPFLFRCFLACFKNLTDISSPSLPPVVASCDDFGSLLSNGRYGALKVIMSNLFFTFLKRLDFMALNPFCFRCFIDFWFMSTGVMFFLSRNSDAVSGKIPEPVPMSSIFKEDTNLELGGRAAWYTSDTDEANLEWRYFFRKFAKKYESSAG